MKNKLKYLTRIAILVYVLVSHANLSSSAKDSSYQLFLNQQSYDQLSHLDDQIKSGLDLSKLNGEGQTPLIELVRMNTGTSSNNFQKACEIAELMLKKGVDIDVRDEHHKTALDYALDRSYWANNDNNLSIFLLNHHAKATHLDLRSALVYYMRCGGTNSEKQSVEIVKKVFLNVPEPKVRIDTDIFEYRAEGLKSITPMTWALVGGSKDLVDFLHSHGLPRPDMDNIRTRTELCLIELVVLNYFKQEYTIGHGMSDAERMPRKRMLEVLRSESLIVKDDGLDPFGNPIVIGGSRKEGTHMSKKTLDIISPTMPDVKKYFGPFLPQ